MTALLLINPRSGRGGTSVADLVHEAAQRGVTPHVLRRGEDAAAVARDAAPTAVGIAGGDGSLGDVAAVAIERDVPFVCVPFGTRNHFARDIGLDRNDALRALEAFDGGHEQRVDVGRVDTRVFLNNVSIGLYARLVHRRESHRRRRDALARLRALAIVARRRHGLRLTVDGSPLSARVLLVANNHYQLDVFNVGAREQLDDGLLHLYVARGWLPRSWDERAAPRFTIDARPTRLRVAIDGEPLQLETPLDFRIEPQALRVLLPRQA